MRKMAFNSKGFTLMEMIAVLVVLGILVAVAVPRFFAMQAATEEKSLHIALNDMKSRSRAAFATSLFDHGGTARPEDYDSFVDLGFATVDDIEKAYRDFVGTWSVVDTTRVTYRMKNDSATWTFTLSGGTTTEPPSIALTRS